MALPELSAWQLEFARLFAYPVESPWPLAQRWWQALGGEPHDFKSVPKKQRRVDGGTFNGSILTLNLDNNRIVWEVGPIPQANSLPTLGPFREKFNGVVELLTPWLTNSCPPIRRMAFGGKLLQKAETAQQAFRILAAHLPWAHLEPIANDFILQINRRRDSRTIAGLGLNRVSTWSKMNVVFSVKPGEPFKWPDECYSALELDINTAPEKIDILSRQSLPQLVRELADLAVEIAERGDIP